MCLGTPGRIIRYTDPSQQTAEVDFAGTVREVNTAMVAGDATPPAPGDWLMVHMGIALRRMEPEEAAGTQTFFDDLMADFEQIAAAHDAER